MSYYEFNSITPVFPQIKKYTFLLSAFFLLAFCTQAFTQYRIYHVGFSEVCIIVLYFFYSLETKSFNLKIRKDNIFSRFFLFLFFPLLIGFLLNQFFYPVIGMPTTGNLNGAFFDSISYFFAFFISGVLFDFYAYMGRKELIKLLSVVFYISAVLYSFLYGISLYSRTFLGGALLYANVYFAPFSINLHHTTYFLLMLTFLGPYLASKNKNFIIKLLLFAFSIALGYFSIQTGASKAPMGVIVGGAIVLFTFFTTKNGKSNKYQFFIICILIMILIIFLITNFIMVTSYFTEVFQEADNGGARETFYSNAIDLIKQAPLFGRGPGGHLYNYVSYRNSIWWDAHQSILTLLIQGGILALLCFGIMYYTLVKTIKKNGYLLAVLFAQLPYILGADIFRRPSTWIFLPLIYFLAKAEDDEPSEKKV